MYCRSVLKLIKQDISSCDVMIKRDVRMSLHLC